MGWNKGEVLIAPIDKVPILAAEPSQKIAEQPLIVTVGVFDETASGKFKKATRYGKTPSHTQLNNGLTLEAAQTILNSELNRLIDKKIEDYGLIWTEIAEWAEMETWLLYYGQRFSDLICFNAALTMDIRNETVPSYDYPILGNRTSDL